MKQKSWSRRDFLRTAGAASAVSFTWNTANLERVEAASQSVAGRPPKTSPGTSSTGGKSNSGSSSTAR
jgi:hypothetical protein